MTKPTMCLVCKLERSDMSVGFITYQGVRHNCNLGAAWAESWIRFKGLCSPY